MELRQPIFSTGLRPSAFKDKEVTLLSDRVSLSTWFEYDDRHLL